MRMNSGNAVARRAVPGGPCGVQARLRGGRVSPSGPRGGLRRTRCWDPVGGEERISESALDTWVRPSARRDRQHDSRACAGRQEVLRWPQSLAVLPLSGAQQPGSWGQLPPAPHAGEPRPPDTAPRGRLWGSGASHSLLSVTSQQDSLWSVLLCGDWRVWVQFPCSHTSPLGTLGRTAAQAPTSGTGPGLFLPTFKLRMLTAASPPLCASLSPPEVSRGAQPPQWSESPLPLRTVGERQGLEPGGVYAQGPSLT